jgi:hypothetical protein
MSDRYSKISRVTRSSIQQMAGKLSLSDGRKCGCIVTSAMPLAADVEQSALSVGTEITKDRETDSDWLPLRLAKRLILTKRVA